MNQQYDSEVVAAETLVVESLGVEIRTSQGWVPVLRDVSFSVPVGEVLGIVGESGSGKTILGLSLLGLLPAAARYSTGAIHVEGSDVVAMSRRERRDMRGDVVSMIFQDALHSLNPAYTVGDQIAEAVRAHHEVSRRSAWLRAEELMSLVGVPDPTVRSHHYPHMLSGGMRQRVVLAVALASSPRILIADEPTTALDVTIQAQVLRLLKRIQSEMNLTVLFITHDLGVVAGLCDRVMVLYGGEVVETATTEDLFLAPTHPYTAGLISAVPQSRKPGERFGFIPGGVPVPGAWPSGCHFHPRCTFSVEGVCNVEHPALVPVGLSLTRCLRASEVVLSGLSR